MRAHQGRAVLQVRLQDASIDTCSPHVAAPMSTRMRPPCAERPIDPRGERRRPTAGGLAAPVRRSTRTLREDNGEEERRRRQGDPRVRRNRCCAGPPWPCGCQEGRRNNSPECNNTGGGWCRMLHVARLQTGGPLSLSFVQCCRHEKLACADIYMHCRDVILHTTSKACMLVCPLPIVVAIGCKPRSWSGDVWPNSGQEAARVAAHARVLCKRRAPTYVQLGGMCRRLPALSPHQPSQRQTPALALFDDFKHPWNTGPPKDRPKTAKSPKCL